MPKPKCLTCDGVGQVIEYRLTWKKLRVGEAPLPCSKKVYSFQDGLDKLAELVAGDDADNVYDPQIVEGARACPRCKPVTTEAAAKRRCKPEPIAPGVASASLAGLMAMTAPTPVRDWKMAQAGE